MGYYVRICIVFACENYGPLSELAKKHLPDLEAKVADEESDSCREALWFLKDMAGRKGELPGPKGGLCTWGMVGNYTQPLQFVEDLKPFFVDMLSSESSGLITHHQRIIVLYENEQSEQAHCYEIYRNDGGYGPRCELEVKHHDLPFCWMQM